MKSATITDCREFWRIQTGTGSVFIAPKWAWPMWRVLEYLPVLCMGNNLDVEI